MWQLVDGFYVAIEEIFFSTLHKVASNHKIQVNCSKLCYIRKILHFKYTANVVLPHVTGFRLHIYVPFWTTEIHYFDSDGGDQYS